MSTLTPCFRVHIPLQLRTHDQGKIGLLEHYYDAASDKEITNRYADECYLPVNKLVLNAIKSTGKKFKLAYSISGTTLELLKTWRPDVIQSFRQLVATNCVELVAETYYNSLAWLYSKTAFRNQVEMHSDLIKKLFNYQPVVFRNTGLVYDNALAKFIAGMGYKGVLCEGVEPLLAGRTPNQLYAAPGNGDFGLLLRNASLSDDIAFRFDDLQWSEQPLTADKYASWIHAHTHNCNINLFLDYETFGIHKKSTSGILQFLKHLPPAVLNNNNWQFSTPSEVLDNNYPKAVYDVPKTITWKGREMEYCVWCENTMQNNMLKKVYAIENMVMSNGSGDAWLKWNYLQAADHFYAMSDTFKDAKAAYRNYVNIITDFEIKLIKRGLSVFGKQHAGNLSIY